MEDYLKEHKMLDKGYRYKPKKDKKSENEVALPGSECEPRLIAYRDIFYTELAAELSAEEELAAHAECMIEQLKSLHLAEVAMKQYVYENTRKMSKRKRKKSLKAIEYALEKKMEVAVKLCATDEVFGELFDALFVSDNSTNSSEEETSESLKEDYCTRKYMVDNGFINTTVYSVTLNPKNVDTAELDCDEIVEASKLHAMEEIQEEFEEEFERPSKRTLKCISKAMKSNHFFENSVRVAILAESKIPDEFKAAEREKFVETMKQMYDDILKC